MQHETRRTIEPEKRHRNAWGTLGGFVSWIVLIVTILCSSSAFAQAYPDRPIHLIVPFSAGSASDIYARLLSQKLNDIIGQPLIVENREGASGIIAAKLVMQAPAHGYMLVVAATPWAITPYLNSQSGYDALRDFSLVGRLGYVPSVLVVPQNSEIRDFKDLLARAGKEPGKLTFASSGTGSPSSLTMQYLMSVSGIKMREIPYKSTAQALQDTIAGRVAMNLPNLSAALSHINAGRVRAIAVTGTERAKIANGIPTIAESGFAGFDASIWIGLAAPVGTPQDVINRLNAALNKALALPSLSGQLEALGLQVSSATPADFAVAVKADTNKWADLIRRLNLHVQ